MSDLMLCAVLRQPASIAIGDNVSTMQFFARCRQAADELEQRAGEIDVLRQQLVEARDFARQEYRRGLCEGRAGSQEPQRCPECGKLDLWSTTISRECHVKHDGTLHSFVVSDLHVLKCKSCGEVLFDNVTNEQISKALRYYLEQKGTEEKR